MKRTTVSLPDDVAWRLEREAKRREVSVSEVVRQVLSEHFDMLPGKPRALPFAALGASGRSDVSERIEEILAQEWTPDFDRDR
ncbi:MAG TPA: CopG family transcriptional regulator [Chloroflexota bacterium]|jgi:Arc/MetJ-type ribon-helix-helix transcriptional regulator|nr:CopG family transcriptional regulator [Chloroflexota bacterium]